MKENYIFTGYGYAAGKHIVTNADVELAVKNGYYSGFDEERMKASRSYTSFKKHHPDISPFGYFVGEKMGFHRRRHVNPFPPRQQANHASETSLELCLHAASNAIDDAQIHPEEIDVWIVSTVSPHEQAPGIASTVKCYFTKYSNLKPAITLSSGCSGFTVNLQRAIDYFKCNADVKNIMLAHTETMSRFLHNQKHFVPLVTFGDAASAIIITRDEKQQKEGLLSIVNYQDSRMIDFVGVDSNWNLYMDASVVKERSTVIMPEAGKEALHAADWKPDDVDLLVPHQTGNAILYPVTDSLKIDRDKLFQEVQHNYGNISGATIPLGLSLLYEQGAMQEAKKVFSVNAGVGGKYGAFAYLVPEKQKKKMINATKELYATDLKGKTAFITGCTGDISVKIVEELAARGAKLLLHYHTNEVRRTILQEILDKHHAEYKFFSADFSNPEQTTAMADSILDYTESIDYMVHTVAIPGGLSKASEVTIQELETVMQINYYSPVSITKKLFGVVNDTILYIGSAAEDAQFAGSSSYVASKKALHGFAASFAGEAYSKGIQSIYYMPGLINGGMLRQLNNKQIASALIELQQNEPLSIIQIANHIVKSLYLPKLIGVTDTYEGVLLTRRHGYYTDLNT